MPCVPHKFAIVLAYCGCTPPTVWMERGAVPETVDGVALGTLAISRTDTVCQCSLLRAASTWDWTSPQPLTGSRGTSFWPLALMSTICGGTMAMAGQRVPGW